MTKIDQFMCKVVSWIFLLHIFISYSQDKLQLEIRYTNKNGKLVSSNNFIYETTKGENQKYLNSQNNDNLSLTFRKDEKGVYVEDRFIILDENMYGQNVKTGLEILAKGYLYFPNELQVGQQLEDGEFTISMILKDLKFDIKGFFKNREVIDKKIINTFLGKQLCYIIKSKTIVDPNIILPYRTTSCLISTYCPSIGFSIEDKTTDCKGKIKSVKKIVLADDSDNTEDDCIKESINIEHNVPLIPQQTNSSCWAASSAMILSYKSNQMFSPEDILKITKLYQSYAHNGTGLSTSKQLQRLIDKLKLNVIYPQTFDICRLKNILEHNPLMLFAYRTNFGPHAMVVTGMSGDGSEEGTFLTINDPWGINANLRDQEKELREKNLGIIRKISFTEFNHYIANMEILSQEHGKDFQFFFQ